MLSIVIPAYNEEGRITPTLEAYGNFFLEKKMVEGLESEIIVVVNNSTDNTLNIVHEFSQKYLNIKYINLIPGGKGFATIMGFKEALQNNSDLIGFVDADMSTKPEAFYELYENISDSHGVIASRWKRNSKVERSFGKLVRSKGFNILVRSLFLFPYKDTQCGAKLFRREIIEKIVNHIEIPEWAFDVNILYLCKKYGYKIKEIPTTWEDKFESKIDSINVPIRMAGGVIRLRLLNSPFDFFVEAYDKLLSKRLKIHGLI
jgi:glycosyltransferase involved in cell wall biosynthesis